MNNFAVFSFLFLTFCGGTSLALSLSENLNRDVLNTCLNGTKHKITPGPEDELHKQCSPWKDRACCTLNTTHEAHYTNSYNFNYNHCPGREMSDKCKKHFVQDLCFYECSPNVGPWLVKTKQKIRTERFVDVPLCASDCDQWYEDCKDDWTCTNNWGRNFDWKDTDNDGKKENICPENSTCKPFKEIFQSAQFFCENIWDHSWKYTPENQPCMRIWFDNKNGSNPNDPVAKWKVNKDRGVSAAVSFGGNMYLAAVSVAIVLWSKVM